MATDRRDSLGTEGLALLVRGLSAALSKAAQRINVIPRRAVGAERFAITFPATLESQR